MELGTIIHAIVVLIFVLGFAYLIWATAAKADGQAKGIGNLLAIAVAVVGILAVVGMSTASMFGGRPFGIAMHHMASTAAPDTAAAPGSEATPPAAASDANKPGGKP